MFWIITGLITLSAMAMLVLPLLRGQSITDVDRSHLNASIFKDRITELEASGMSGDALEQAKLELEKSLAQELDASVQPEAKPRARWIAVAVAVFIPALSLGGFWLSSADDRQMLEQAQAPGHDGQNMPSMEEMVEALRLRMENEPDNAEGWFMLARSYAVMEKYPEAAKAYGKLVELDGRKTPDYLADYAEALALSNNENLQGEPEKLLREALALDEKHAKSLWLMGMAVLHNGQKDDAIGYWQRLLAVLEPGSEDYKSIYVSLEQLGGLPEDAVAPTVAQAPMMPMPPATQAPSTLAAPSTESTDAANGPSIQVQASLSADLAENAAPEDTVFIYARAAQGPRMPLAVARKQVKDLPVTVTLDESMGMMAGMKLSSFPQVVVAARVSKSGQAITQPGDLLGESAPLAPAEQTATVKVEISTVVE
jgi:cytochrome c-type biogenesis protein CcmH